ncbi:MAG: Sapep family Mn(2+)-dependent dipeptidase [Lachnospiraceae bacterium]|nr:Sapep family Mn(2+)-dependent dipeptidase [Lachnospiraceae bacterium]
MEQTLLQKIDAFIEKEENNIWRDLARLVAVNSIEGEPDEGAPFGPGPKQALEEGLKIAEELGLEARNCEGYMGYASVGGDGEKYLATITHLDIVPAGDGWQADPFVMRDHEGYVLGRGVMDDKGPSVVCLYALKYLKEAGIPLRYPIRALLGANEETGMGDLNYYNTHYPAPLFCFSPDADFPLINGEKGIYHARMTSQPVSKGNIRWIKGGFAPNAIPEKAEARVFVPAGKEALMGKTAEVDAVKEAEEEGGSVWYLRSYGKGGHASMPAGTVNGIGLLLHYLMDRGLASEEEIPFLNFALKAHDAADGSLLGIARDDGRFTPLTAVSGMIWQENSCFVTTLDCRYPTNITGDEITRILQETAGDAAVIKANRSAEPFWKEPDCPELLACMKAYQEVTGEEAKPFSIGGGTYARHFPNAVAFGPEHPERPHAAFCGNIHGPEEGANKAELLESLKVYILALIYLEELDFEQLS